MTQRIAHTSLCLLLALVLTLPMPARAQGGAPIGSGIPFDQFYPDFASGVSLANLPGCLSLSQLVSSACVQDEHAQKEEKEETRVEVEKNVTKLLSTGLVLYVESLVKRLTGAEVELGERSEVASRGRDDGIAPRTALRVEPSVDAASSTFQDAVDASSPAPPEFGDQADGTTATTAADLFKEAEDVRLQGEELNRKLNDMGRRTGAVNLLAGDLSADPTLPEFSPMPLAMNTSPPPADWSGPDTRTGDDAGALMAGPPPPTGIRPGPVSKGEATGYCTLPEDGKGPPSATEDVRMSVQLMGAYMLADAKQANAGLAIGQGRAQQFRTRAADRATKDWMRGWSWANLGR